jgi:hypothetical protein
MKDLQQNTTDHVVSALKGVISTVPFVGSAIAEAISVFFPQQRMDRLAKFLQVLSKKVEHLDALLLQERLSQIDRVELLYEGATHASRAVSDERRSYLANMVAQGIAEEKIDFSEEMHLLKILSDLTDVEVIILRFYLHADKDGDKEFRNRHEHIYQIPPISKDSADKDEKMAALQMSYRVHLGSLGLLHQTNVIDSYVDEIRTTDPKDARYKITDLGKLLLGKVGLDTSFDFEAASNGYF